MALDLYYIRFCMSKKEEYISLVLDIDDRNMYNVCIFASIST